MINPFDKVYQIVELYPEHMNIYGDTGNSLVLQKRFELFGLRAEIKHYNIGDAFPEEVDVLLSGGGQDSSQAKVVSDLMGLKSRIGELAKSGVPMLVICGMYQLFGKYFQPRVGDKIPGLEVFDAWTIGEDERLIGNLISRSSKFGELVGYENHSGQTFLGQSAKPLAEEVLLGAGNNAKSPGEGCLLGNAIGTYMHGPALPKNPQLQDFLISAAVTNYIGRPASLTSAKTAALDELALRARAGVRRR